jgi:hypothetical protein
MQVKQKLCKACGKEFKPFSSLQQVCNYRCAIKLVKAKKKTELQKMRKQAGYENDRLRHKADKEFQLAIQRLYPKSLISEEQTQVAHHWVYKSHSNALRYYIPNGIPLSNDEHGTIHGKRPEEITNKIILARGTDWIEDLEREKQKIVKLTDEYLIETIERLKAL